MSTTATSSALAGAGDFDELTEVAGRVRRAIEQVIEGKPDVVEVAVTVLLAEGHLLIEDVPGVGKTMLAKALARSIDCTVRRIQFTPDLLPSDITGVSVFNQEIRDFEFKPGAVFANIVVGDEINRASPKTQSALLESHGGAPGHRRHHDVPARGAVHGDRDAEPDRDGGHLSRSPRPSATASWPGSRWATPSRPPSCGCSTGTPPTTRWTTSSRSPTASEILPGW